MARSANRYLENSTPSVNIKRTFKVGNYLRLSVDSDYTGSDSLENQRKLAKEYVEEHVDLVIVKEYVDDGKTGTNFRRPAFSRMITDLKQGIIDCVLVKDLSRFGRDYIEAGNYIEKVFPFLGIRFISIVDKYDSANIECDRELLLLSLKNLMHEMYARDISKKVGSTFQVKQEKRIFYRSASIPYGYQMNEDNKNYCIEENTAAIIREIFLRYDQGQSRYAISRWLYENAVLTPTQYRKKGYIYQKEEDELKVWSSSTIQRILRNPVYIGDVVRHKTEQSFCGGIKSRNIPESEQIIIKSNHPAIVEKEMFIRIQKKLEGVKKEFKEYREDSESMKKEILFEKNIFSGKLFCGDCKCNMTRIVGYRTVERELERFKAFQCTTHRKFPESCSSKNIGEKELCEAVYKSIRQHISLLKGAKKQIRQNVYLAFEGTFQLIEKEKNRIQNSVVILEQEYMEKYMQYTVGDLAGECFQVFRSEYIEKKTSLENQMKELVLSEKQSRKQRREQKKMFDIWEQFYNEKKLTEYMVESCVERVEVFSGKRLSIRLRYQDQFQQLESSMKKVRK